MTYELILKEEADRDVVEACIWYNNQQPGLGELFLEEVEKYLNIIKKNPNLYAERHRHKRVAVLRRFPYIIAYEKIE